MRRRLRKKKRLGEFVELGFSVHVEFLPSLDNTGFDAFLDRWIDAIEARGLLFGGGGRQDSFEGFVTPKPIAPPWRPSARTTPSSSTSKWARSSMPGANERP
jgi:uncharacterized protein YggL (DUF469 family)